MQGIFSQIRYFESELSKSFKKDNRMHVIRMALVCHSYITRMYLYVIRMSRVCAHMSLICTRMSSVCHSYVVLP